MKKAISVLSGGLDCTVATSVYAKDYEIHAITFNYGQKAFTRELKAAKEICKKMGFTHTVIDLPWLAEISNSSLNTSEDIPEVPELTVDDFLLKSMKKSARQTVPDADKKNPFPLPDKYASIPVRSNRGETAYQDS